jgi:vancomycin resistance protein VanJ
MRWWPGDRFLPVQWLNYFMPWLLAGLLPALLSAGLARRKWLSTMLVIPTVLIVLTFAPLFLPRADVILANQPSLKVMSFNTWWRNRSSKALTGLIQQEQPDLIFLQELNPEIVLLLKNRLSHLYPDNELHFYYEPGVKQGIISRYPITPLGVSSEQGRVQKARLETPYGQIMVWNVHPLQPLSWSRHYQQMVNLAAAIAGTEAPLIVAGDFNTTDQSETYGMVNQYLTNAHWQAGWGFGFSFPASRFEIEEVPVPPIPMVRIDHIFYSDHFFGYNAYTVDDNVGSDHFPVVAELSWIK